MQVVPRAVTALVPYERNARTHTPAQVALIAASIREWGFTNPVLIDEANRILAGHGRLLAAQSLGMAEVPCVVLSGMTDTQRRAYILADNQLALRAGWDNELLALELGALRDAGFDLAMTGFEDDALERLLGPTGNLGLTDADDVPDSPAEPVSRPGDLWQCGQHRVLCGDALQAADMDRLMDGRAADLTVTDPPYNVAYVGKAKRRLSIANDAMSSDAFYRFLLLGFARMLAASRAGAPVYVFHADLEGANFRRAFTDAGFTLAQCCVWAKPSFVLGRHDYHWQHEPCIYGWKPGAAHRWHGDRKQSTLWTFDRPARSDAHPTMKPVALIEYLVTNSSRANDVVLDPFGGSGTTLIACTRTGRIARLVELEPRYCDVIVQRWQAFTGEHAIRETDGVSFDEVREQAADYVPTPA
ncbi:hypothetical protein WJ39_08545 [Burkholderia diffusa]|nr:site-specific DNA-methyltransferase [Burkholderia diffusa]KVH51192.1 hypothetical protein WJ39_08545 [Burkholderia diffusa]